MKTEGEIACETANEDILRTAATPVRALLLEEAVSLTTGDRNRAYGEPVANMQHIADIYNAITGQSISARDVTTLHRATKLARAQHNPTHRDSHVDEMAYAGIGYECALAGKV
jgi:hypothetical protein